ncbi:hypothetical protein ACLEE4_17340 [Lonsdalea quercina]|uniref:hypothetical protein n=1 Tax=Lonsdalea quercina TaxID=71657 RepID=UPI0039759F6F
MDDELVLVFNLVKEITIETEAANLSDGADSIFNFWQYPMIFDFFQKSKARRGEGTHIVTSVSDIARRYSLHIDALREEVP